MKGKEKEQLYQKRNYDHYRFSMKELLKYMGQALALCIMADYLFYKSKWVLLLMLPVPVFYLKWQKNRMIRERRKNLNYQFKDALTSLSVAVQAGYSVESAVKPVSEIWRDSTERERILWRNFAILKASSISVFRWKSCFWILEKEVR